MTEYSTAIGRTLQIPVTGEHTHDIMSEKIQIWFDSNLIKYTLYIFIEKSAKKWIKM